MSLNGVFTALITPFKKQKIDWESFQRLVQLQIRQGIDGFVIAGTTAESACLTQEEVKQLFLTAKKIIQDQKPILVGTGSNSTEHAMELSQAAESWGADGLLSVVPYYNKPPQRGLIQHFTAIADSVKIPVVLYNVPSRTITSLELESIRMLSQHPQIIGIKEASGNITFAKEIRKACGPNFALLSGDDISWPDFYNAGGDGVISVASHILPEAMKSRNILAYKDLINFLFVESNPIPVKKALQLLGTIECAECRLPLVEMEAANSKKLEKLLVSSGLLKG